MTQEEKTCLSSILEKVEKIEKILTGNGSPEKGMIVRIDRLEQWQKIRTWAVCTLAGAIATGAATYVFTLLVHHKG